MKLTAEQIADDSGLYFFLGSDNYPELISCMEEYAKEVNKPDWFDVKVFTPNDYVGLILGNCIGQWVVRGYKDE